MNFFKKNKRYLKKFKKKRKFLKFKHIYEIMLNNYKMNYECNFCSDV